MKSRKGISERLGPKAKKKTHNRSLHYLPFVKRKKNATQRKKLAQYSFDIATLLDQKFDLLCVSNLCVMVAYVLVFARKRL